MIKVTRLNGLDIVINADLIEFIESTPDTVLTLSTGTKFLLKDSVQDVVNKVIAYRQKLNCKPVGSAAGFTADCGN